MKKNIIVTTLTLSLLLLGGCGDGNSNAGNSNASNSNANNSNANNSSNTTASNASDIGKDSAKEIALKHANVKEADISNLTIYLETEDGVPVYDVEFHIADKKYDYEITAADGTIYASDVEVKNSANTKNNGTTGGTTTGNATTGNGTAADSATPAVSEAEAKKAALEKVSGATEEHLTMKYKHEDGRYVYDGEIRYNQKEYDFEIDANTGKFLEWTEEHIQS